MARHGTAQQPDHADSAQDDREINAQLTNYITAHAIKIPAPDQRQTGRRVLWRLASPFVYLAGILMLALAMLASLAIGLVDGRKSTRLWDRLRLPVPASDVPDDKNDG